MNLVISHLSLKTRIGNIWLGATPRGIFHLSFGGIDATAVQGFFGDREDVVFVRGGKIVENAGREILRYLEGRLRRFSVRLDLTGSTSFSRKVWRATSKIPFGQVRTYGWVAERVGDPLSARAVGRALGANPVPIVIPCHRVVGSHGWLGGYSSGLSIKRWLLAMESGQPRLKLDSFMEDQV